VDDKESEEGADAMDVDDPPEVVVVPDEEVSILSGHTSEVFICAWNPVVIAKICQLLWPFHL
jgi:hypothetical protein